MLLTLLHPILFGAALHVQSAGGCPSNEAVATNLQSLVELSEASSHDVRATLKRDGAWLDLELLQSDGSSLGQRRIEASNDCDTLARAAAVVLATWLSNEHPEFLVALPSATPAPEPVPVEPPAPPPVPEPPPPPPPPIPARVTESAPPKTRHFVLGATIGSSASSSEFAPAASLEAGFMPITTGWGARLSVAWIGARSEPLAAHEVSWTRWPVMLGPNLSFVRGKARFELEAGPALGWLRLEGRNFEQNFGHSDVTFGGYGSLRFVPKTSKIAGFVSITPLLWLRRSTASVTATDTGTMTERDLPAFELLLSGGMRLGL